MQIIETKKPICKCGSGQVYTKQKGTILVCRSCGKEEDISNNKKKIVVYFAHPKDVYNTEYELNCINKINELHPDCKIINPRDIKLAEEDKNPKGYAAFVKQMEKYYFSIVKTCDLVSVAKTGSGKISPGVQMEIKFALANGVKVEYLDVPFPEDNWPTFPIYNIGEIGYGHWTDTSEDGLSQEIDIEEAIDILTKIGVNIDSSHYEGNIEYCMISYEGIRTNDDQDDQGIYGLYIPKITLDYIKKKGYIKKEDKTKCRTCGSIDINRVENSGEWRCNKCGNNIIQCWVCQNGTYASYIRNDEDHYEVFCEECIGDNIDFDENGNIDKDDARRGFRKITIEEFRSGEINWNH